MKRTMLVCALLASAAIPAQAITFSSLTTIYVGTGVRDDGGGENLGIATNFSCSNVSGVSAQVRFLVLGENGTVASSVTITMAHGETRTASTHLELTFDTDHVLATGIVGQGVVNIESTQSGVFCNAIVTDADVGGSGFDLNLVRVNPHPGTVE